MVIITIISILIYICHNNQNIPRLIIYIYIYIVLSIYVIYIYVIIPRYGIYYIYVIDPCILQDSPDPRTPVPNTPVRRGREAWELDVLLRHEADGGLGRWWNSAVGKPWENIGKVWENHGKNHKTMGKPWEK